MQKFNLLTAQLSGPQAFAIATIALFALKVLSAILGAA
jgi:hypothetical protein